MIILVRPAVPLSVPVSANNVILQDGLMIHAITSVTYDIGDGVNLFIRW